MQATASFFVMPVRTLPGLRQSAMPKKHYFGAPKDLYPEYLHNTGRAAGEYPWPARVLAKVVGWLKEEHQLDLLASSHAALARDLSYIRRTPHFIFTPEQRAQFLAKIDPDKIAVETVRAYYGSASEEFDAGAAMKDGVQAFHTALSALKGDTVVVLVIG
jgi:hypothetical protein